MQPYLFPYIGYFQLMHAVDRFVVADDHTFIKQGWINRNRLLINGEAAYFTVPLKRHPSTALIREVEIDAARPWSVGVLKTIANFYRRAPSFKEVYPIVERVLGGPFTNIADMARSSLTEVRAYLEIGTSIVESAAAYRNSHLKGQDRVIDICLAERATDYVNAPGGRELYSRETFRARGIGLHFIQPGEIVYRQFAEPFVPSLSIIDLLMFNSRESARELLLRYELG